MKSLFQTDRD